MQRSENFLSTKHLPSLRRNKLNPSDALSRVETCFYTTYVTNCWSNLLTLSKAALKNTEVCSTTSFFFRRVYVVFFDFSMSYVKAGLRLVGICLHWTRWPQRFLLFGLVLIALSRRWIYMHFFLHIEFPSRLFLWWGCEGQAILGTALSDSNCQRWSEKLLHWPFLEWQSILLWYGCLASKNKHQRTLCNGWITFGCQGCF